MSPLAQLDRQLESIIRELTMRIVAPKLGEFDWVWDLTNSVCDRYGIREILAPKDVPAAAK